MYTYVYVYKLHINKKIYDEQNDVSKIGSVNLKTWNLKDEEMEKTCDCYRVQSKTFMLVSSSFSGIKNLPK